MSISASSLAKKRGTPGKGTNQRKGSAWDSIKKHNTTYQNTTNGGSSANHPWFHQSGWLAAHHIIPIKPMDDMKKFGDVAEYVGYNINHWRNIVVLPTKPQLACQLGVQIHAGNHNAGIYSAISYPLGVKKKVQEILRDIAEGDLCDETCEEIVKEIDELSEDILEKIDNFTCFIGASAGDYKATECGCCNVQSLESEKPEIKIKCVHRGLSPVGLGSGHKLTHLFKQDALGNAKIIKNKGKLKVGH